jgi:hypothetical protein
VLILRAGAAAPALSAHAGCCSRQKQVVSAPLAHTHTWLVSCAMALGQLLHKYINVTCTWKQVHRNRYCKYGKFALNARVRKRALKGLACRARVTLASSHASPCLGEALTSPACRACCEAWCCTSRYTCGHIQHDVLPVFLEGRSSSTTRHTSGDAINPASTHNDTLPNIIKRMIPIPSSENGTVCIANTQTGAKLTPSPFNAQNATMRSAMHAVGSRSDVVMLSTTQLGKPL